MSGLNCRLRIEDVAHARHRREVVGRNTREMSVALLVPDAVLAADRAAQIDGRCRICVTRFDHGRDLLRVRAGRTSAADASCRRRRERRCRPSGRARAARVDRVQRLREFGARDARRLECSGSARSARSRRPRLCAPAHSASRSACGARARHEIAPCRRDRAIAASHASISSSKPAISIEQHGAGIGRIAGVERGFDRFDDQRVHHLERGRYDSGADDRRDRFEADSTSGNAATQTRTASGSASSRTHAELTMPERAFAADQARPVRS